MSTAIGWTDETWNPIVGCTKISPGCANCYAEVMAKRLRAMGLAKIEKGEDPGKLAAYIDAVDDRGRWTGKLIEQPSAFADLEKWSKPRMVFVNSMSDLFHEDVSDGWIMRVLDAIARNPHHKFQILTKRPKRAAEFFRRWMDLDGEDVSEFKSARGPAAVREAHPSGRGQLFAAMLESMGKPPAGCAYPLFDWMGGMMRWDAPPTNMALGTSVENPKTAEERIPELIGTPGIAVRFLSMEPLIEATDLDAVYPGTCHSTDWPAQLDWIIVGGESGPDARPCSIDWIRDIVSQCQKVRTPVFVKQIGGRPYEARTTEQETAPDEARRMAKQSKPGWFHAPGVRLQLQNTHGSDPADWPEELRVQEFPRGW